MNATQTFKTELMEAAAIIGAAKDLLARGSAVDIAGLEPRIDAACNALVALPPEERRGMKPALLALIDELNALAQSLDTQYAAIGRELSGVNRRDRALTAYQKGGTTAKRP